MKVEAQGRNECVLATIAALSSRPLSEVRDLACEVAMVDTWNEVLGTPQYWSTVASVARTFRVTGVPTLREWKAAQRTAGSVPPASTKAVLPTTGQGSVAFRYSDRGPHICPFENGYLYDSSSDTPMRPRTLEEFCRTEGAKVRGIFPAARKAKRSR